MIVILKNKILEIDVLSYYDDNKIYLTKYINNNCYKYKVENEKGSKIEIKVNENGIIDLSDYMCDTSL